MKIGLRLRVAVALFAVGAVGIQLIPVERTNPPVQSEITAPADVVAI